MARNKLIPYRTDLKDKARKLRNESTYSEVLLWLEIKNRQLMGYQFHRQVPMLDYIVDFYRHELMLVIEVDGDCHASEEAKSYDLDRQKRLEAYGVGFLRFDDARMKMDINKVLEEIKGWIQIHGFTPLILPSRGDKDRRGKFSSDSH
jgi:very-short-patch-repair endonuclease